MASPGEEHSVSSESKMNSKVSGYGEGSNPAEDHSSKVVKKAMDADRDSSQVAEQSLVIDSEICDMIEMTAKAAVVLTLHMNESLEGQFDRKRAEMLRVALLQVLRFLKSADVKKKMAFINGLVSNEFGLEGLAVYIMEHWSDVKPCSDPFCPQFCQLLSSFLITVSDISDAVRKTLAEVGLATSLLRALSTFKKAKFDDDLKCRVLSSLILLSNCSQQALDCHEFDNAAHVLKTLAPYLKSTDPSIRMTSHGVAVCLSVLLSEDDLHKLALTPEEVKELVTALRHASANPDLTASVFNVCLSAREILVELDLSMAVKCNMALILQSDVHNVIPSILAIDDGETLEAAISFVWTVAVASRDNTLASGGLQEHLSTASEILAHLSTSESATSKLAEFAFLSLQPDLSTNIDSALKYIEGCYLYGRLLECQGVADMFPNEPMASLYKAKSLFKHYQKAMKFYAYEAIKQQNPKKHLAIMKNAKTVVSMLSAAMMNNYIDEEGKEMLDISMMDVIRGSNELNKVSHPHCMLCLCSDADLQKSHVYPKSMLKEFAESIPGRVGERVFTMLNTSGLSPKLLYHYSSPKTVRYFMLCRRCEDLVNKGGEIDFLESFFLKIFNKTDPAKALEQSVVTYGPWLYHFCVGFVFRCIASGTGISQYANEREIYQLFLACRKFLVSPNDSCETTPPKVYLFINPSEVPHKYEDSCVQEALNAAGFVSFQSNDLSEGVKPRPLKAHFVIAHCGIINVLVKFSPDDYQLPSSWEVDPQGGTYVIPAEADREKDIPPGVWMVFEEVSESFHNHFTESLFRKKDRPPDVKPSPEFDTKQYSHLEAWSNCGRIPTAYIQSPEIFTTVSMLPSGFKIDHFSGEVTLPASFSVLIHHVYWSNDVPSGITLLVGVDESPKKSTPAPFVIFCHIAPHGAFFVGFSVKFDGTNYNLINLSEVTPQQHDYEELYQVAANAEVFINERLPSSLVKKGFPNFQSLLSLHAYKKHIPTLDMKCHDTNYSCWYCRDLCENCLAPDGFGPDLSVQSVSGFLLTFCSQDCTNYYTRFEKNAVLDLEILPPKTQQPLESQVFLRITQETGLLKMDEGFKAICVLGHGYYSEGHPNGRFFIACQFRTLHSQKIVEMFVSEQGIPEESLPHASSCDLAASPATSSAITGFLASALLRIQELFHSKYKEEVELNLDILAKLQDVLFSSKNFEVDRSIKLTCESYKPRVDIHGLITKLSKFKDNIIIQKKVDVELSVVLQKVLTNLSDSLRQFPKESSDLQRLLHCYFDFLCECIRGLKYCCNDENGLASANSRLIQVWKSCNSVMAYTSSAESCRQFQSELVSTLLDSIAQTTHRDKGELLYLLHLLLDFCAKDKNYRQLFGFDSFCRVLQPLLDKSISGARFLALLILSFFIDDRSPKQQLLRLTPPDIQILKIHLTMKLISSADALHLIKTASLISDNVAVLKSCDVVSFVSQFLEEDTEERNCAAEIITILQSACDELADPTQSLSLNSCLENVLHPLSAYNIATAAGDSSLDMVSCTHICRQLNSLQKLVGTDTQQVLQTVPTTTCNAVTKELSTYLKLHLMHVSGCKNPKCSETLHLCGPLLIDICRYITVSSQVVVSDGLVEELLTALENFKDYEQPSKDVLARIILCLVLLHLCSSEAIKQYVLDDSHQVISTLLHYYHTPYLVIWMYAKINTVHLGDLLDGKVLEILELTEEALSEFISKLSEAVEQPSLLVQVFGGPMTAKEIITFLSEATLLETNCTRMLSAGLLECFPVLLQNPDTLTEAARLLWTLTLRQVIRQRIEEEAPLLYEIARESSETSSSDILELLHLCLKGTTNENLPDVLKYARGCFSYNMLTECAKTCERLLSHDHAPEDIEDPSRILLAKCQHQQYRKLQRLLSMRPYMDSEYIDLHKSCYALAGKVLQSLQITSDSYVGDFDEESMKILDITLMDIAREGNESLKKYQYCLLCKQSKCDLQHSHVLPKAILELFTASMSQTVGKKAFRAINIPKKKRFRSYTSKELAFYVFCRNCEGIFNDLGEKGFLKFFKAIYNPEHSDTLEREHKLEYGPWLYHFCVSYLFRGIATGTGIPDHMESSEVYKCFLDCRKFLLGEYIPDSSEIPKVFLLFNPTTVPQKYELEVLNQILLSPSFFFCDSIALEDGSKVQPPVAQFIVAHVGIMNVVVVFGTSKYEHSVLDKYLVSPSGGACIIPRDSERVIPKGLWKAFASLSSDYRKEMQDSFFHKKDKLPRFIQTAEMEKELGAQEAYKIMPAKVKDSLLFADQCESEYLAQLNLLPETFIIKRESSVVSLPPDHHLLLHFNTPSENGQGSSALIGVRAIKGKQRVKPFVIHYQFSPKNVFCVGFYLTQEGAVESIICDSSLDEYPTVRTLVEGVQESVSTSLPIILNAKGFVNMRSLLYHFQHSTFECPLDTKCSTHPRCWYCCDRCENCLKRATTLQPKPLVVDEVPLKFCSKECQAVFHDSSNCKPITVVALATRRNHSDTEKIEEGHTEICCIAGEGMIDGEGFRFKISVRTGYSSTSASQQRYYCIWNLRRLFVQQCAELFLNRDTSPDAPLPHVDCAEGQKQVNKLRDEGVLQGLIQAGFRVIKRQQQSGLPPSLAQTLVTEEIPTESAKPLISAHRQLPSSSLYVENQELVASEMSETEREYESMRQLAPALPSIHSLKTFKPEDIYPAIAQYWNKISRSDESTVNVSKIINTSIALLLQADEDAEVLPLMSDVLLSLLCKCLQNKVHKDNTDLSLIQSAVKTALSQQSSQSRVFAMMVLSCYSDQDSVKDDLKLTKEDIQVIRTLAHREETIRDILTFLDIVKGIEDNLYTLRSHGGIDLLGSVIDMSEVEEDVEEAALLLEALLNEK